MKVFMMVLVALSFFPSTTMAGEQESEERARQNAQPDLPNQRILNKEELEEGIAPHVPAIQGCYKTHAAKKKSATGRLWLELLIRPEGYVQDIGVRAPGVRSAKLKTCIVALSDSWRFAEKAGFTNAILPFWFVKTNVKGGGPLYSCTTKNSCPKKKSRKKTNRNRKRKARKQKARNNK